MMYHQCLNNKLIITIIYENILHLKYLGSAQRNKLCDFCLKKYWNLKLFLFVEPVLS